MERYNNLQFLAAILEIILFFESFKTFSFITYNISNYSKIWSSLIQRFRSYIHWMVSNSIVRHYWPPSWKLYFFKVSEVFHSLLNHRQYMKIPRI